MSSMMAGWWQKVNRALSANDFGALPQAGAERCAFGATKMNKPAKSIPIGSTDHHYCFARSKIASILERDAR